MYSTPTALVVAAPTLLRQGLVAVLRERWPQLHLTLTADTTQLTELATHRLFGVLVLDGVLAGRLLPNLLDQLYRSHPTQRLLLLTDPQMGAPVGGSPAKSGTRLHLSRHVPPPTLTAVLTPWLDAPVPGPLPLMPVPTGYSQPYPFSPRELEVLHLLVADYPNEEIAKLLFVSVRTVESHRRNLLRKAGTRTLVGLVARAVREGWVA